MRQRSIYLPELFLVAATRGVLGVGIGLLAASRVSKEHRTLVGTVLVAIGALSTIPLAIRIMRREATEVPSHRERSRSEASTIMH